MKSYPDSYVCGQCRIDYPIENYYKNKSRKSGFYPICRECHRERVRLAGDPEKRRAYQLKKKYGMSLNDYAVMLDRQNGVCDACQGPAETRWNVFHVDHCHATGKVRGLLCGKCNVALGMVDDKISRLEGLISYLRRKSHA